MDRFSAEGARGHELETSGHGHVAVVAYGQSLQAPCKKLAQLGLCTVATTLELVVLKP